MSKYQKALNEMYAVLNDSQRWHEEKTLLQELVDRATPKKLIQKIDSSHGEIVNRCPICGSVNFDDKEYHTCWNCGQAIDWSEDSDDA